MNVFITGGTGFVGKAVIESMLKECNVFANFRSKALAIKHERLHWVKADLESEEDLVRVLSENKIEVFVNLIGIIKETKEQTFKKLHYEYPKLFLQAGKKAGIKKFIQMSALGAGEGIKTGYFKYKEETEEEIVNSGINYTVIRPSMIFGKGDESINMFRNMIKTFHIFPLLSWGNYQLQPVSINEVARVFAQAVMGKYDNKIVEVAGPKVYWFKELLEELAKLDRTLLITIPLPGFISKLIAGMGDKISFIPITSNMLKMLLAGNFIKPEIKQLNLIQILGKEKLT